MIVIRFTECDDKFVVCKRSELASKMPIGVRCDWYEKELLADKDGVWATFDEHLILIAQWLRRHKRIDLELVSVCAHSADRVITVDDDGDMVNDSHHGFFGQRLRYLR